MEGEPFEIRITPAAQREIDRLPNNARTRVETAIENLANDPRPHGCVKMHGIEDTYRIRVGNYRVMYQVFDRQLAVLIVTVADRKDIYRH